ncbi:MAG: DUF2569 family protein [Planctomycetota bacterium]
MDPDAEPTVTGDARVSAMEPAAAGPRGIGGWLILPAIGLILGVVGNVAWLALAWVKPDQVAYTGGLLPVELVFRQGLVLWLLLAAVRFFRKKDRAPETIIAVMITWVLGRGGIIVLSRVVGVKVSVAGWGLLLLGAALVTVGVLYFRVSKRVKNTFVNP